MYLTGFTDEASTNLDRQIQALKELNWANMESRLIEDKNIASLKDSDFEKMLDKLKQAEIQVNCYGSAIANWQKNLFDSPESSYQELKDAAPRLHRLDCKMVRIMSFQCPEDDSINTREIEKEVIKRMQELCRIAKGEGLFLLHENCNNWGGRSYQHTLRLLDALPSSVFGLVFDTGNPVFRKDIRFDNKAPYEYQSSRGFYNQVKEFISYIHIKDGYLKNAKMIFSFPGEGQGDVAYICQDLCQRKYKGGISIEPHMATVFHDKSIQEREDECYNNFIEYGRRMESLLLKCGWKKKEGTRGEFDF